MTAAVPVLRFRDFSLAYRGAAGRLRSVLEHVDLEVPAGGLHLLVGPSGSGKSSLLKLITGAWETREPAPRRSGRCEVLGVPVRSSLARQLRGRVQAVFQDEGLLDELTPRQNVEMALRAARRSVRLAPALLAGAGLATPPAEVAELSGGMRKRVAVARALAGDPELLLFDEPTAGLDETAAREIAELIAATQRHGAERPGLARRNTIVITHDLRAFEGLADGVLRIDPARRALRLEPASPRAGVTADAATASPESSTSDVVDLHGVRRLLLEVGDYGLNFADAVARILPRHAAIALRTVGRFVVESAFFVVLGCATVGGLATFFALRNNPLEGAFAAAVVGGAGKVLVSVLVPLLAGFFFTARIAAGAAARLGTMKRTGQVQALRMLGVRPADYLLIPLVWGCTLAMPALTAAGIVMASAASWLATRLVTGMQGQGWAAAYVGELSVRDVGFVAAKTLLAGFLIAVQTYHLAMGPKRSGRDVGVSVNSAIVSGMVVVLFTHALLTLLQFR
ncbi:MAG: ABC transporter permease [Planctomycetes bacterium]|nr:ABC transporter permease [Planctomycetota bacterium]